MRTPIGIDAIALAIPRGYVELAELAQARGVAPEKYTKGLGTLRMAIAAEDEDPVTLATDAAARLFATSGRDRGEIGLCAVGTETAVDHSKPVASYVHGLLGLPPSCRVIETKHACFGGTASLLAATEWIASGAARGRSALVICTDIARYEVGSAGEPTQGAGAVALLVSERPRILELEVGRTGSFAQDVHDFWRPLHRRDALVDGHFSVTCYLDALAGAYGDWKASGAAHGWDAAALERICYHVPYGKMARKAHLHRAGLDAMSAEEAEARFAAEVAPSLSLSAEIGNVYTGSLYLALASLLHGEAATLEGARVGLFSYGSGCGAEFFAGRVAPGAGPFVQSLDLTGPLASRRPLSIAAYEALRGREVEADRRAPTTASEIGAGARYHGVDEQGRRVYTAGVPADRVSHVAVRDGAATTGVRAA